MHTAVRQWGTTGIALAAAGVIAARSVAPPPDVRIPAAYAPAVRMDDVHRQSRGHPHATGPAAAHPQPHRRHRHVTLGVGFVGLRLVIYRSEHDGLDPFLPKGSRPSSRQTTTSSATATPRLFQVEVANARATHADTPRSVGGRFADRVTPCPTPIGNGACLTTTRQASRYGDRPRPTRQPRTREWREACETLEAGGRIRAGLTPAGGRLTVCSD